MKLADVRKAKKMSQSDLSSISGVSQACISQIERGLKDPTLGTLRRLAVALNVSISKLIGDEKPKPAA